MRLAAIYIPTGNLPHVFGKNHRSQTLNLGARYNYFFEETDREVKINRIENNFINNFFGQDISLISAIVGRNAVGKTSILRSMNHSIDSSSKKLIFVIENTQSERLDIINETEKNVSLNFDATLNIQQNKTFQPLFYSPNLDYDLIDTFSPITLINYFADSLENYYLDSIARNVSFLSDQVIDEIKQVYNDFPSYDHLKVSSKKLRKSKMRAPYLESNFGTPHRGDALKNELIGDLMRLEAEDFPKSTFTKKEIIDYHKRGINLLESESFTEQFTKLWDLEDYKFLDDSGYDYIHNSSDFIKNTEINILSYLLLGATFPRTGLGGGLDFSIINITQNFYERLNFFLEMYFVNEYKLLTEKLKSNLNGIKIEDSEKIKKIILEDKWEKEAGVETRPAKERMIRHLDSFLEIYNFYERLIQIITSQSLSIKNGNILFDIRNRESKLLFDELILRYKYVLKSFPNCPIDIVLFNFSPNRKLSTGEKAILDFYSSLYFYIDVNKESEHTNFEYYLLMLDEPDLGFHPLWKKKFINALTKTLPVIFSNINPVKFDENNSKISTRTNPYVQIIFTTHDPLTLSDIPNENIVYLFKNLESGETEILDNKNSERPCKSFAANITDLLADSFFIDDGLIGDFAKEKIKTVIKWLDDKENIQNAEYYEDIIKIIDEPIVQRKLAEMFDAKMHANIRLDVIDKQISDLQNLKKQIQR